MLFGLIHRYSFKIGEYIVTKEGRIGKIENRRKVMCGYDFYEDQYLVVFEDDKAGWIYDSNILGIFNDFDEYLLEENKKLRDNIDKLSKREIEILSLIAAGMSNNDIANALYITTNTTQWHISHIYSKLGVKSRTQAVLKARESGIL
jgi:DNA-binding CsgD family transcriptional regulator